MPLLKVEMRRIGEVEDSIYRVEHESVGSGWKASEVFVDNVMKEDRTSFLDVNGKCIGVVTNNLVKFDAVEIIEDGK